MAIPRLIGPLLGVAMALPVHAIGGAPESTVMPWLHADHWIARMPAGEDVLLDAEAVARANRRMLTTDPSITDLASLADSLERDDIIRRIDRRARLPEGSLWLDDGSVVDGTMRRHWEARLRRESLPGRITPRYALTVRRAAVRRLPVRDRVLTDPSSTDIDHLQETAFFPGTPVAILHETSDGAWQFVLGATYDGWIETESLACGDRDVVVGYAAGATRTITGRREETVFVPTLPAISDVALDMGTCLVERREWPLTLPVNGQSAAAATVVDFPARGPDGSLALVPVLLPLAADSHDGPLPASRANVLRQAFKFLGERYGWGHDFGGRDCSGFVSDVYRSLGLLLPRNADDQATSPALERVEVPPEWSREQRLDVLRSLEPGDLVSTGRHVMMVVGHDEGPWIIHDTRATRPSADASVAAANGVVVQPLVTALTDGTDPIAAITSLIRVLPPRRTTDP